MKIEEILQEANLETRVDNLKKGRGKDMPEIDKIKQQWNPKDHDINNPGLRPDKTIFVPTYDDQGEETEKLTSKIEKVARVAVAMQKLIVKRAAAFLFGNPVKLTASDEKSKTVEIIGKILKKVKQVSINKKVARICFSATEVAEYWYAVEGEEDSSQYGVVSKKKIRCVVFNPLDGDKLYPYFDEFGDMVAFSRESTVKNQAESNTYFETWTKDTYTKLRSTGQGYIDETPPELKKHNLGKIPIVYASQEESEWTDVQNLIDRMEKLLSNFADTNDYHGSPKTVVKGELKGYSKKGQAGSILEIEGDGDIKLLSYEQAPESVKTEIDNLLRLIFSLTQTPDISFDAVKGLGNAASGASLRMLFLDAHLKVMDKLEIFEEYLERRINILKAFASALNGGGAKEKDIEITPVIVPYMVDDKASTIDNLVQAVTGGILSKETAVGLNPYVEDPEEEAARLEAQRELEATSSEGLDNLQDEE